MRGHCATPVLSSVYTLFARLVGDVGPPRLDGAGALRCRRRGGRAAVVFVVTMLMLIELTREPGGALPELVGRGLGRGLALAVFTGQHQRCLAQRGIAL